MLVVTADSGDTLQCTEKNIQSDIYAVNYPSHT